MNALIQFFIHRIVAWVSDLDANDFKRVKAWVQQAELTLATQPGESKAARVRDAIQKRWPDMANWVANVIIELAVAQFRKRAEK